MRLQHNNRGSLSLRILLASLIAVAVVLGLTFKYQLSASTDHVRAQGVNLARLERDGEVYYALLLGVYDNVAQAEAAMTQLPPGLDDKSPWVRSVGSLQTSMRRADALSRPESQEIAAALRTPSS